MKPLPICRTCPAMILEHDDRGWCHAGPPTIIVGAEGKPVQTMYVPVNPDKPGCILHPRWPRGGLIAKLRSLFT